MELVKRYENILDNQNESKLLSLIEKSPEPATKENLNFLLNCVDLTSLNTNDFDTKIASMAKKVNTFSTDTGYNNVAAICVYPPFIKTVKENLTIPGISIAAVSAGFPSSQTFEDIKVRECKMCVEAGADEIDIVLSVGKLINGEYEAVFNEIKAIKKAIGNVHLKVILETGLLNREEIAKASLLSLEAGADFIKTSTGKLSPAATHESVIVMCQALKFFYQETGQKRGLKPAGGISETEDALKYLTIVKNILGKEWMNNELFRIGASRLVNNMLLDLYKIDNIEKTEGYF